MCANMCSLEKQFPLFYFYIILYSSMSFYYIILLKLLLEILSSIKGGMGFVPLYCSPATIFTGTVKWTVSRPKAVRGNMSIYFTTKYL